MLTIGAVIWLGGPPRGTPPRIRRLVVMNGTHPHVRFRNVLLNPRQTFKSLVHLHAAVPVGPEWVLSRHAPGLSKYYVEERLKLADICLLCWFPQLGCAKLKEICEEVSPIPKEVMLKRSEPCGELMGCQEKLE